MSDDEQWSTLPTRKKPQSTRVQKLSSNRPMTGGFRLPTSFLGVPKSVDNVQGKVRPKMTLLTLYQPPPPLISGQPDEGMDEATESASDPTDDIGSGASGGSDVSAIGDAPSQDQEGEFRFSCPDYIVEKDDQDTPFTRKEDKKDERHYESDLIASLDPATLHTRFPTLVDRLQEVRSLFEDMPCSIHHALVASSFDAGSSVGVIGHGQLWYCMGRRVEGRGRYDEDTSVPATGYRWI
jgi:hypothetical protein